MAPPPMVTELAGVLLAAVAAVELAGSAAAAAAQAGSGTTATRLIEAVEARWRAAATKMPMSTKNANCMPLVSPCSAHRHVALACPVPAAAVLCLFNCGRQQVALKLKQGGVRGRCRSSDLEHYLGPSSTGSCDVIIVCTGIMVVQP